MIRRMVGIATILHNAYYTYNLLIYNDIAKYS